MQEIEGQFTDPTDAPLPAKPADVFMTRRGRMVICGLIGLLYLVGLTQYWWPNPDSALYLSLGRSISQGNGYTFNGQVSNAVTPGLPLILAGIRALFGQSMWGPNLFVVVCGLAAIVFSYHIVAELADRRIAMAVTVCLAFSYRFYLSSHLVLTEAPTALALAMLLYCYVTCRSRPFWITLVLLFALSIVSCLLRAPMLGLLLLASVGVVLDSATLPSVRRRVLVGAVLLVTAAGMTAGFYLIATSISETTPLYVRTATDPVYGGASLAERLMRTVPGMLWRLPEALAEMMTGQSGRVLTATAGVPLLAAMLVGAWSQWRRRSRLVPFLAVSFPVGTALLLGGWAIRPRYFMPIQFLMTFLCLNGLGVLIDGACRLRAKSLPPHVYARVLNVFVAIVVAVNMPRIAKVSFYHAYLALSGRFYQSIRHGNFADLPAVGDTLRQQGSPDLAVAAPSDKTSMFHFLSERRMASFPAIDAQDEHAQANAEAIMDFVHSRQDVDLVVFDFAEGSEQFRLRLRALVEADAQLLPVRKMEHFHIYQIYRRADAPRAEQSLSSAGR